mgnify:CR=1 FL=1
MRNPLFAILSFLLLLVACAALHAQAGTSPSPSAATSPVATATPAVSASPEASVAGVAAPVAGGGPLVGTWKVERAIFELFGAMKDDTAQDERHADADDGG